jgi:hypothetical protein
MDGRLMARTRIRAGDAEIIREAKKRFERCVTWESTARANALFDSKFAAGDSRNMYQWDQGVRNERGGRPCLTNNLVRQHNLLIVNDARQNKAAIKVTPTGGRATFEAAQVYQGIIRRIEYQSKAADAYSTAAFHQVESGIGYVRVVTDYADEESFDQELFVRRIADPKTVYLDPDAKDYDKADMNFGFVFTDIPRDRLSDDENETTSAALDHEADDWNSRDHVREAEYWRRNEDNDSLHLLADGTQVRESDLDDEAMEQIKPLIQRTREIATQQVEWFKIRGNRIVDRGDWGGKYIPIVPAIGEETVIDGQMDRKGHTRAMIDAQRIDNYWSSAAVEFVALQGKSPFIAPASAIEGHEQMWETANVKNWSVLTYNSMDDAGQPIPPPQRAPPPVMPQAYIEGMRLARDDLLLVSGQHQADLGMPGNERSGKAIDARQRQGDRATGHYTDNQAKMIRQVGRILLDLIPHVYDVARVTKIMAADGTESDVHIMPNAPDAHQHMAMTPEGPQPLTPEQAKGIDEDDNDSTDVRVIFNPTVGKYDVEADIMPQYATQRQEAANAFSQIMAQNPEAFQIVGDFWAQNSDFPGADKLAERLRRGLPPQFKSGPDPQVQQMQQAAQQMHQQAQQMLQQADAEIASLKAQIVHQSELLKGKADELDLKSYDAETRRLSAVGSIDPTSLTVVVRQLVQDMLQTELHPILQRHAEIEAGLQQTMQPPQPEPNSQGGPVQ